ncbi:glycosyltransferase [Flavobacterium sp. ASW18X]|nr:glycosyltransferase [Flavobacterium sp. ASW18X]
MNPKQGGPCQGIRNSIGALKNDENLHEVVCLDAEDEVYGIRDDFTIYKLGRRKGPWQYHKALYPWLLNNLTSYDVVIIHGLWTYHSYAVYKAIKKLSREGNSLPKVFVMPHGMLDPYFQKSKERRLKAIRNEVYWGLIERKVVNNATGLLFTCEQELLLARQAFKQYRPRNEYNVGYGVQPPPPFATEMTRALRDKLPNWNGEPYLLFLSRIHQKKGVDLLIKAYNQLSKKTTGIPKLIIAGPGMDSTYGKELEYLTQGNEQIIFPGMLNGAAKWGAFYHAAAFVLPSHQENFGIAVAEAMACKKPVLISDKVNIWREIVEHHGGIANTDTLEGTLKTLKEWFAKTAEEQQQMGMAAFESYGTHFTIAKAAQNLMNTILNA